MEKLKGQLDELGNSNDAKMITTIFQDLELPKDLGKVIDKLLNPSSNELTKSWKAMQKLLYQTFSLLQKAFEETAMWIKDVQSTLTQSEKWKLNLLVGWQEALADANGKFAGLISTEGKMSTILKLVRDNPTALANYFENQVHKWETQARKVIRPLSTWYEYTNTFTDNYEQWFDQEAENMVKDVSITDLPDRLGEINTHYTPLLINNETVYFNTYQLKQQEFLDTNGTLKTNQDQVLLNERKKWKIGGFSLSSMVDRLYDNPNFLVMSEKDMRAASDVEQKTRLDSLTNNKLRETPNEKYFFEASSIDQKLPAWLPKQKKQMREEVEDSTPLVISNWLLDSSEKKSTHGLFKVDLNGATVYGTEKNIQKLYKNYAEKLDRNETTAFATNRSAEKANLTLDSKKLFLQEFGIEEKKLNDIWITIENTGDTTVILHSPDNHPFSIDMSESKGDDFTLKFKLQWEEAVKDVTLPKVNVMHTFSRTAKLMDLHGKLSVVWNKKRGNQTKERTNLLVALGDNANSLIENENLTNTDISKTPFGIDNLSRDEGKQTIKVS